MTKAIDTGLVVRSSVTVPLEPGAAFRLFTQDLASWWPLGSMSVFGDEATSVLIEPRVGGRMYESTDDGRTSEWGVVTDWQPGERLGLTWHPGHHPERATLVTIAFRPVAEGGTQVDLVHTGWHARGADVAEAAEEYRLGWPYVLDRYVAAA